MKKLLTLLSIFFLFASNALALSLTVFPDPDPETTSVDGSVYRTQAGNPTWADTHDGAGTSATPSTALQDAGVVIRTGENDGATIRQIGRGIILFDTSTMGSGCTVSAATESITGGDAKVNNPGWSATINIFGSTPASNTDLVAGDYSQTQSTAFSTAITYANWSGSSTYNDFAANSTFITAISCTGITKTALREAAFDAANSAPPSAGANQSVQMHWDSADTVATTTDPKLVITYTAAATAVAPPGDIIFFDN